MERKDKPKRAVLRTVNNAGRTGEDAVSEAIGYILIFTITVIGIAMITVYAYPLLLQSQAHADEISAEQTLLTLRNDIRALTFGNVPYRETTVRIAGGSLELIPAADSADKFVLEYPQASGGGYVTRDFKSGELRYSQNAVTGGGTAVFSLENGAVLKREKGAAGSLMIAEPRWYIALNCSSESATATSISRSKRTAKRLCISATACPMPDTDFPSAMLR